MKHIVSFSGGMGSFAEAISCVEKFGNHNTILLFADTNMEDEDLYRFKDETLALLGCELITLNNGLTPFDVFKKSKIMGNSRIDPCSDQLKRKPLNSWFKDNYKPNEAEMHLGIDYSESHRLAGVKARMQPWVYRSTLIEDERIIPKDFSLKFGIKPPRLYSWGLGHNNCGGFCIKAGLGHYRALWIASPERYKQFEDQEQSIYDTIGKQHPFLRKEEKYITLKQYRQEYLELEGISVQEGLDFGGCGCAI